MANFLQFISIICGFAMLVMSYIYRKKESKTNLIIGTVFGLFIMGLGLVTLFLYGK